MIQWRNFVISGDVVNFQLVLNLFEMFKNSKVMKVVFFNISDHITGIMDSLKNTWAYYKIFKIAAIHCALDE